ncbi:hypothetical protein QWT69_07015 [Sporosarcina oncorhynchi]|uniref:YceG-like family protein n=1 Tax=Sporosarcina oncorhynchi TaxID=3056444 RepID=A0ABZ0L994_9BACL|nr:hypothetical protein [Sporosarcina sp. T2O-4]WOV88847.1 hypothetical protein QWT69_07015 [Sporosarcina sp. T2O-4]
MIKLILRSVGIGCILAAGVLYFTNGDEEISSANDQKEQLKALQTELNRVKEELAVAQTLSLSKEENKESSAPLIEESESVTETVTEPIVKSVLTIEPGSNSTTVADKLERSGILVDGSELEQYLTDHQLSGRIQIGEHEVDSTMSIETIAGIITNTKK